MADWLAENGFKATHAWYGTVQLSLIGFGASSAPTERLDLALDNGIVLEGYRLPRRSVAAGETLAADAGVAGWYRADCRALESLYAPAG